MLRVPRGSIDCVLQVHLGMDVPQEELRRPLVLLITSGRAPRQIGFAVAQRERRAERCAWTLAGRKASRVLFVEPEHLRARAKSEAKFGNDRGRLKPTTRWRRRYHIAGAVNDVEVDRVAADFAQAADRWLAGAKCADGKPRAAFSTQFDYRPESLDRSGSQFE